MLQIVIGASVGHEYVHDDVGIIQQHPVLGVVALRAVGLQTLLGKLVLHLVGQRRHLRGGSAGGNDKVIGEHGQAFHLEHTHIVGLFLIQDLCDLNGKCLAVVEVLHMFFLSVSFSLRSLRPDHRW